MARVYNLSESFKFRFVQEPRVLVLVAGTQQRGALLIHRIGGIDSAMTSFGLLRLREPPTPLLSSSTNVCLCSRDFAS